MDNMKLIPLNTEHLLFVVNSTERGFANHYILGLFMFFFPQRPNFIGIKVGDENPGLCCVACPGLCMLVLCTQDVNLLLSGEVVFAGVHKGC